MRRYSFNGNGDDDAAGQAMLEDEAEEVGVLVDTIDDWDEMGVTGGNDALPDDVLPDPIVGG